MYPNLTPTLLVLLAIALGWVTYVAVRRPFLRRLALRQVRRRPAEALLVVAGSVLGTTMILASFIVGDTLNASVRQVAYTTLGPVDERVVTARTAQAAAVTTALAPLANDPRVDGLLTVRTTPSSVTREDSAGQLLAEPRAVLWETDFAAAAKFGGGGSGLSGTGPRPGEAVLVTSLAETLRVRAGDVVTFYPFGVATRLRVARIVEGRGLAGLGEGTINHNAFVAAGTLATARRESGLSNEPVTMTLVSNRGGVIDGNKLTARVKAEIDRLVGRYAATGTAVQTPKHDVLKVAQETGDALGAVFLFVSSFSIIAGVLLLVNVFVMLAEDRRSQLGMLRAIGMRRARLVGALTVEGTLYAAVASVAGIATGIGVGRLVVIAAERIFRAFSATGGGGLSELTFAVTRVSVVNGVAMGLLIAFVTVLLTSVRISSANVIAAIRDLPAVSTPKSRRRVRILGALGVAVFGAAAVPAVADATGPNTYLLPPLALVCAVPLLTMRLPKHTVYTGVATLSLLWGLFANILRDDVFDNPTMTTYIVLGSLLTFAAVVLISENQRFVLWPVRRLVSRPTEGGLAARLAVAYPVAKKFRTGATLAMFAIVIFTLVMLTQMMGIMGSGVGQIVEDAARGYDIRVDYNPATPFADPGYDIRAAAPKQVAEVLPLRTTVAEGDDPSGRWTSPLPVTVIGVNQRFAEAGYPLDKRLPAFHDDAAAWWAVAIDERYVVVDSFYGATGGPNGETFDPGSVITVTDPRTGKAVKRIVAGLMTTAMAFDNMGYGAFTYPVFVNETSQAAQFGDAAVVSSALVKAEPGVRVDALRATLQGAFVRSGLTAFDIERKVRDNFAANIAFFRLMQGFLGLGLAVGITGLGVVMVRAVRERRRTIGVLRALGVRARTIRRSFLVESAFVALEGILVGTGLSILTSYLIFVNSPAFAGLAVKFPVMWGQLALIVGVTFAVSMLTTLAPAGRAARIKPALAVRVAD